MKMQTPANPCIPVSTRVTRKNVTITINPNLVEKAHQLGLNISKMTETARQRPEFRNINAISDLPTYRLPAAGWVSILHRISGAILFVGKGKKAESLRPFWRRLRSSHAKIKAVAMDQIGRAHV